MFNTESNYQYLKNTAYQPDQRKTFRGGDKMAFVNEYISDDDRKKYDIDEIDKRFIVGGVKSSHWTIDRDRNIYLRRVSRGREELSNRSVWTFYWKNELIEVTLDLVEAGGKRGGPGYAHWKLIKTTFSRQLEIEKEQFLLDLKAALNTYKDAGCLSTNTSFQATLDA